MKNVLMGLLMLVGVTASLNGEARDVRPSQAAASSASAGGIQVNGLYYSCAPGLRPQAFISGGVYQTYAYVYPFGYVLQNVWIPGPGVWCVP